MHCAPRERRGTMDLGATCMRAVGIRHAPGDMVSTCTYGQRRSFRDEKVGLQNGTGREPMADLIEKIHMALVQNDQCFTGTTRK